ncbi:MAG: class I SAM-dependent methyltransferase [Spirochaetaceae bacterium]|jgi:ubiquinone/menaquinone biosynthesis C-methylase UbiE|nr:class I SAM-dependent methyltransferase [Spirochaetaceae bacterium]
MENSTLFEDKSDLYASARHLYPPELFKYISTIVRGNKNAWDCATGSGQAAVGLSPFFDRVEATDISNNQISNAFDRKNIKYSVQPAEETNFKNQQFDLVNVAQALHWFDFSTFWNEVQRVLKPNGLFITYSYSWSTISEKIDEIWGSPEEKKKRITPLNVIAGYNWK